MVTVWRDNEIKEALDKAFKEGQDSQRKKDLKEFDRFVKDRTAVKSTNEGTNIMFVKFMPFEWEDFKKKLEKEQV